MYCSNCGAKNDEDAMFCAECGMPMENIVPLEVEQKPVPKKKPILPLILGLIAVAVLLCVIFFVWSNVNSGDKAAEAQDTEAQDTEVQKEAVEAGSDAEDAEESEKETAEEEETVELSMSVLGQAPDLTDYTKVGIESAGASSEYYQAGYDNSALAAFDGIEATSWQENASGSGIGEWICGRFNMQYNVKYIGLKLGNWRDDDRFWGNNRPIELEISIGGYSQLVSFSDEKKEQWVELSKPCSASDIIITIKNVNRGTNTAWDEGCISEIEVYAE